MTMSWTRPVKTIAQALRTVFARPAYLALALAVAVVSFASLQWAFSYRLIADVFATPAVALTVKLRLLASLLASPGSGFDPFAWFNTIAVPLLFGVNIALVVYFLHERHARLSGGEIASEVGAVASGVIAAGCAACGSFLLVTILSLFGATGALALLPWGGGELGLLSVALLVLSIYLIARRIVAPAVCELPSASGTDNRA